MALLTDPQLLALLNDMKSSNNNDTDNICNICSTINDLSSITLSCNHQFHEECLLKSMRGYSYKKECPYCRTTVNINAYKSTCTYVISRGINTIYTFTY